MTEKKTKLAKTIPRSGVIDAPIFIKSHKDVTKRQKPA